MDCFETKKGEATAMAYTPEFNTHKNSTYPAQKRQNKNHACFVDIDRNHKFCIEGQKLRTLNALIDAGDTGITALSVSCWAYRLASYIYDLRHDHGLDILTTKEPHEGGFHGRYELISNIQRS